MIHVRRVNDRGIVKVADFGLSRQLISREYYKVENGATPVPVRWMAPECLAAKLFTTKSDVVSSHIPTHEDIVTQTLSHVSVTHTLSHKMFSTKDCVSIY